MEEHLMKKKRVLIIGLDGATFDIIRPMVDAGKLPTFAKFMKGGAWGPLRSTIPPITAPAWTSFMTGVNPGKHGVSNFYTQPKKGSYETGMISRNTIKAPRIWNYLERERVGLIDIPMTYPPEEINGCMISGWPVPSDDSIFTYPSSLHMELIGEMGEYMIDRTLAETKGSFVHIIEQLHRYTDMRRKAALYLINNKGPFDFFMVVFRSTDFIQHEAFKFMDEAYAARHPQATKKFKCLIPQFYEKMDSAIADLMEAMGKDAVTIIMSDHGGGPMKKKFYINRWLREKGLFATKPRKFYMHERPLRDFVERSPVSKVNRIIPKSLKELKVPYPRPHSRATFSDLVDWAGTSVYAIPPWKDGALRVNLKGREPEGIVDPKDYDRVVDDVKKMVMELTDPETGEKLFEAAYRRDELYTGPYVEDAADIVVVARDISHMLSPDAGDGPILETPDDPTPAPHRMHGIMLMHGPDIKRGKKLEGLNITDIAPTSLYLLGKAVPEYMDGKVMTEGMSARFLKANPPSYSDESEGPVAGSEETKFSAEEEDSIKEGLRALGYMD